MPRISPVAIEVRNDLIIKSASVDDALSRACQDIYVREMRIANLEKELARVWGLVSGGFARLKPCHHARQIKPPPADPVTDDWIATGRE